jgi:hypothetical protein
MPKYVLQDANFQGLCFFLPAQAARFGMVALFLVMLHN